MDRRAWRGLHWHGADRLQVRRRHDTRLHRLLDRGRRCDVMVLPKNPQEWSTMVEFLREHAGVHPSADLRVIGWVSEGKLVIVVGLNGFLGKLAQIHIAFAPGWHFSPRDMLEEVFRHAFISEKREMLLGVVNSNNAKAMRWDQHLGFRELYRLPGMHDGDGDVVLLAMKKDECRYLTRRPLLEKTGSE